MIQSYTLTRDQLERQIFHGMDGELDEMRKQHDTMVVRMTNQHSTLAAITTCMDAWMRLIQSK